MMPGQKIYRAVQVNTILWLPVICGLAMSGFPDLEVRYANKVGLGSILRQQGEFHKAITVFNEALQVADELNDDRSRLECFMQLGILHWNIGQVGESSSIYHKARTLSLELGQKDLEAKCAAYIEIYEAYVQGKKDCASGLYKESISRFSAAIDLARKINSPEHEIKCLRQMSFNYFQTEMYPDYLLLNERGLEIAKKLNHKQEEGRFINNVGLNKLMICEYSEALKLFKEALEIAQMADNNEKDKAICLNNIGLAYFSLGYYKKALLYLERALEIDLRINAKESVPVDLNNIGTTYSRKGRYQKNQKDLHISLEYYLRSLNLVQETNDKRTEIDTLNNIGLVYKTLGYHAVATKYFRSAIRQLEKIEYAYEACNIHSNLGDALFGMGKYQISLEHFKNALEIAANLGRDEILWEAYNGLGKNLEKLGQEESALACYKKAIDTIDRMRSRFSLDDFRTTFSRDKMSAYELLIQLLLHFRKRDGEKDYDLEVFRVIERAKARSFLEELGGENKVGYDSVADKREHEALSNKLSVTISHLAKPGLDDTQRDKLLARLESEEEEYLTLLNRIKTKRLEDAHSLFPEIESVERIREQCLDENTAILEYYLGEEQSIGMFLDRNQLVLEALPPRGKIEDSLKAYLKMISTPPNQQFMGIQAAQRIYQELIFPFEGHISPFIKHLLIIPDGILYYLPFETLNKKNSQTGNSEYLIEIYDISYAPSVSSLAHLMRKERRREHSRALLAVGDPAYFGRGIKRSGVEHADVLREIFLKDGFEFSPLPHSRKEIRRVSRYFPKEKTDILMDSQASEESIKNRLLEEYQIIHFACHGFLDEKTPMRSALVLAQDDDVEEDGFLQAREISDLNLSADLVVLSACQTAKGRLENAEGVLGLPRTFFYAGARSTISSLWKISDKSTAEIMPNFYRYLTSGKSKARALRLAKLKMLESSYPHPFYWAAFVLNGDFN